MLSLAWIAGAPSKAQWHGVSCQLGHEMILDYGLEYANKSSQASPQLELLEAENRLRPVPVLSPSQYTNGIVSRKYIEGAIQSTQSAGASAKVCHKCAVRHICTTEAGSGSAQGMPHEFMAEASFRSPSPLNKMELTSGSFCQSQQVCGFCVQISIYVLNVTFNENVYLLFPVMSLDSSEKRLLCCVFVYTNKRIIKNTNSVLISHALCKGQIKPSQEFAMGDKEKREGRRVGSIGDS